MYEELKKIIEESNNIVFFGGAGVSTESNIPDFRSEAGLYQAQTDYGKSPEEMISHSFFMEDTETFFDYYKKNLIYPEAKPNKAHLALAQLEAQGKLSAVVTQNIDGLHQLAGSKNVYELHGSVLRNFCMTCGEAYDLDYVLGKENCRTGVPICRKCGGIVKPDVVLYEEALDDKVIQGAVKAISKADTLIIGGTSLVVYPAASFVNYFRGDKVVLINKSKTAHSVNVDLQLNEKIGQVLGSVMGL
ncbi:MAG: NAD-dependent protein deacylase [Anaerovoracaceae bacterium]